MYHTTGFTRDEIVDLRALASAAELEPGINHWPPVLGLFRSVVVVLTYMRRNHVQGNSLSISECRSLRSAGMLTPIRKPANRGLLDWEKEFSKQAGRIRYRIEQAIANLKTWHLRVPRLGSTIARGRARVSPRSVLGIPSPSAHEPSVMARPKLMAWSGWRSTSRPHRSRLGRATNGRTALSVEFLPSIMSGASRPEERSRTSCTSRISLGT